MKKKILNNKLRTSVPEKIVLERIKACKIPNKDIIDFPVIFSKLCVSLQIKKEIAWQILLEYQERDILKIIFGHGIKLNEVLN